nr:manganese efflux pump MntP family protein [uncultured Senegalimassilia sp.]
MVQEERVIVGFVELFLIGVGLSMDAFAVSVCKGLGMSRLNIRQATIISLFFGGFQALMPLIGWALGSQLADLITPIDHWIAFALLAFVGGKMLWDAFHEDDEQGEEAQDAKLDLKELIMLAIATSIDALAVGITFAFLQVAIVPSVAIIGVVTFMLSFVGVAVGHFFGARFEKPATITGGAVLILIGVKTLLEHLGVIAL